MQSFRIDNYRNVPGQHCGSTAMRNLIRHYCGVELTEAAVFGLGSGLHFMLIESQMYDPGVLMFGRGASMEVDLADALGLDYTEQMEIDDEKAWLVVREEVLAGRPTMLSGDALYLDYRDFKVHFPSHRFVLVGFDDAARIALIADRIDEAAQPCAYDALAASRNPKDFISTYNLWGKFHGDRVARALPEAYSLAIRRAAERMIEDDGGAAAVPEGMPISATAGIGGLSRLAERLPGFLAGPTGEKLARYAAGCIESFGTGGGNFRLMYSAFLREACEQGYGRVQAADVEAMSESARLWTALAEQLRVFAGGETAGVSDAVVATVRAIRDTEARLFERLASVS
ncbi:MAG: DUF4872 domain-containing protein [Deltaproteobacteria bacterium]|nr:DUF4872 domain-containing protein [Deltaproteobacteria bacterium]